MQQQLLLHHNLADMYVPPQSPRFTKFINFLTYLKTNTLQQSFPCICMECCLIISKAEVQEHRSKHPKQVTPSFQDMKMASRNDIQDLCTKHNRIKDGKVEMFRLSQQVMDKCKDVDMWKSG